MSCVRSTARRSTCFPNPERAVCIWPRADRSCGNTWWWRRGPREANGLGLRTEDAVANVNAFLRHVHLYEENEDVSRRLRRFAVDYGLRGPRLHDANIAATMSAHGIRFVVTQNGADFAPFDGIEIVALSSSE